MIGKLNNYLRVLDSLAIDWQDWQFGQLSYAGVRGIPNQIIGTVDTKLKEDVTNRLVRSSQRRVDDRILIYEFSAKLEVETLLLSAFLISFILRQFLVQRSYFWTVYRCIYLHMFLIDYCEDKKLFVN